MKRMIALMLALLTVFSLVACSSDDEDGKDGGFDMSVTTNELVYRPAENPNQDAFYYEYINGNEIAIVGYSGTHVLHTVTVPDMIDERKVTEIAADAFKSVTSISAVTLPDSIVSIGDMAFYGCTEMTTINMPASLVTLGEATFAGCIRLTAAKMPATLTSIGYAAFYNCKSLTEASLPTAIKELPNQLFMNCERLKTVTWSAEGLEIGNYTFLGCAQLESVNIPATLTKIGNYAFSGCAKLTVASIPAGVQSIGVSAFNACAALQEIPFATTEGWYVARNLDAIDLIWKNVNVEDAAANVANLTDTYNAFYWKRIVSK